AALGETGPAARRCNGEARPSPSLVAVCPATFGHDERVPEATDAWTRAVCGVVKRIPPGRVATYGLVGVLAGRPLAARAVGNALHHCDAPDVPFDRVRPAAGLTA